MLSEALAGQGQVYFVDAAHFVYGVFLAVVWCFCRTFIKPEFSPINFISVRENP